MGLDPATMMALTAAGQVAGPVLANLFAPEGQELSSFEGRGALDPVTMLNNVNTLMGRIGQGVTDRAATPVGLPSAYVQQPGVMTGGGMAMPIGLVASDPALSNPSLLNLPGMGEFQNIFTDLVGQPDPTDDSYVDPDGYHADPDVPAGDRRAVPRTGTPAGTIQESPSAATTTRRRGIDTGVGQDGYGNLVRGADLMAEQGDDLDQGLASAQLLLDALNSGDPSQVLRAFQ